MKPTIRKQGTYWLAVYKHCTGYGTTPKKAFEALQSAMREACAFDYQQKKGGENHEHNLLR